MKRFQFRLDRLVKVREYRERQLEVEMAAATRKCLETSWAIESLAAERAAAVLDSAAIGRQEEAGESERTPESVPVDIASLVARDRYLSLIDRRSTELAQSLVLQETEREKVRQKLADASRARKVLEKLKERKIEEYARDGKRHEGAVLDEIAGNAVVRTRHKGER